MGAAGPVGLKVRASWALVGLAVSAAARPDVAASASQVDVLEWVAVLAQGAAPEAELVWAAWVAREPVGLAEAVPAPLDGEHSRRPAAVLLAPPRGLLARDPVAVRVSMAAVVVHSVGP
ncbi:hypothetical protein DC008_25675 [Streptomyces nigra]|nr:hypothetical protein DC008_25675 [Streptomyces nigra]